MSREMFETIISEQNEESHIRMPEDLDCSALSLTKKDKLPKTPMFANLKIQTTFDEDGSVDDLPPNKHLKAYNLALLGKLRQENTSTARKSTHETLTSARITPPFQSKRYTEGILDTETLVK